ncbi:MAG TPA: HD domain-containing phosphohydrolase [Gemmatimonadaceae bacterium]|nr:HD domain-containing phosphohydrolase [Gemmatimonadaceae bacterium]
MQLEVRPHPARPERSARGEGERAVASVLVVDDELSIRLALARHLHTRGYEVQTAESGTAALDLLRRQRFAVMLCDLRMPGMSGVEVAELAAELDPELAVVMMSAYLDTGAADQAAARGVADFLLKPLQFDLLLRTLDGVLHRRAAAIEQRAIAREERAAAARHAAEGEHEPQGMHAISVTIAEALVNAMEAKDLYLRGHSQRVAELAASMAEAMGFDPDEVEAVRLAGRLHDVGKIGIREEVLNKPGALTPEEFDHVKDHVRVGMEILAPLKQLGVVLDYVHDHHEHWDGHGYPRGLVGEAISIGGRILAAADAFDALTSRRAYREPMTPEETLAYLAGHTVGTLLDPRVYEALETVVRRRQLLVFIDQASTGIA